MEIRYSELTVAIDSVYTSKKPSEEKRYYSRTLHCLIFNENIIIPQGHNFTKAKLSFGIIIEVIA